MNMDRGIVNRALAYVGEWHLTDQDIADKNTNYQLCKAFYLQTFLEALSEVPWTGGRVRKKLVLTGLPHLRTEYRFTYDLPYDCVKPIELHRDAYFVVEDRWLITDLEKAELLYVSSGRRLRPDVAIVSAGLPGDIPELEYITAGPPGTEPDFVLRAGTPADIGDELPETPEPTEDYPDYIALEYEPKFYQYIELLLAAKFAVKQSTNPNLHALLMQESMAIKQEAINASGGNHAARQKPSGLWTEEYGFHREKYAHN
jgi:hypothetical protein